MESEVKQMKLRYIRKEAVTESGSSLAGQGCNPMLRQLLNPTEELAPHTNDPQRSVSVLFFELEN